MFPGPVLPDQLRVFLHRPGKQRSEIPIARLADPLLPAGFFVAGAVSTALLPREWADAGEAKCTMLMIPRFPVRPIGADITESYIVHIVPRAILQTPIVFPEFFIVQGLYATLLFFRIQPLTPQPVYGCAFWNPGGIPPAVYRASSPFPTVFRPEKRGCSQHG